MNRKIKVEDILVRQAPHNIEAEQALLGAILINNEAYEHVSGILDAVHFYDPLHGRIFQAIATAILANRLADAVTLKPVFVNEDPIGTLTVPQYLGRLARNATSIINARDYARTIRELSLRRDLIALGEDMVNSAYDGHETSAEQIKTAEDTLFAIATTGKRSQEMTLASAVDVALEARSLAFQNGGVSGVSTGFSDLDAVLGGLQRSDLIILGARPSMGKSALAQNIAAHAALDWLKNGESGRGAKVAFFSLEMSAAQIAERQLADDANIDIGVIRSGKTSEDDEQRVGASAASIKNLPIWIDETAGLSIGELSMRARRYHRLHGIGLIIVDYLQLMRADGFSESKNQDVTKISNGLKVLAKELNVPVLALSQLSRQCETRQDKRPMLSDLRDSGSIEQDADVVLFVYREEYYLQRSEPSEGSDKWNEWEMQSRAAKNKADVIIAKHRNGNTGVVTLQFQGEYARFSNLARNN